MRPKIRSGSFAGICAAWRFAGVFRLLLAAVSALAGGGFGAVALAVEVGEAAPPFVLPSVRAEGAPVSLADYRGRVVYLDFWSSWCAPCRRIMPALAELRAKWPREKFEVLALNLDTSRHDALRFLEQVPVGYPIALDVGGATARRYGVAALPAAFVLDAGGGVQRILKGAEAENVVLMQQAIEQALRVRQEAGGALPSPRNKKVGAGLQYGAYVRFPAVVKVSGVRQHWQGFDKP